MLSIFLFRKGWMDWGTSNSTMKSISRIVWNFFEQRQDQMQLDAPEPVVLTPPAGYAPIKDEYISVASTGFQ